MFSLGNVLTTTEPPVEPSETLTFGEQIGEFFRNLWANITDGAMWGNILTRIVVLVVVIVLGHYLIKLILGILRKVLNVRPDRRDPSVNRFIVNVVNFVLKFILVIAVIAILGISLDGLSSVISSAILAIGLSLQDLVGNFAAGVQILSAKPFHTGDWIEVDGVSGTVVNVEMLSTALKTADGQQVIIPNKTVINKTKVNYNAYPTRRSVLDIAFPEEAPINDIKAGLLKIISADERVLTEPGAEAVVTGFENNQVNLSVRYWATTGDYWNLRFDLNQQIIDFLQENDYGFSYFKHAVMPSETE